MQGLDSFGMGIQGPPFMTSNGTQSSMVDVSMSGLSNPIHQFPSSSFDMHGMMGMSYPGSNGIGMGEQDMVHMQALMQQQMQQFLVQQQQLQQMFPNPMMGLPGGAGANLLGQQMIFNQQQLRQQQQQLLSGEINGTAALGGTLGAFPGLPPASDPETLRQAMAAFAAGVDAVLPGMGMAAAGQLLPSLASGIPQTLLPPSGIVPPLLGMMPGITPYPNIMPTGMLPSNMSYPPGLGGAVMPPPQLLAAAAAAATLQPPLIVPQTSLPSSLLLPPQIEAYNLHPVDNPVEKRLKRKQSNRESARRSRIRKQSEAEGIEEEVKYLVLRNASLQSRLDRLEQAASVCEDHNRKLKNALEAAICGGADQPVASLLGETQRMELLAEVALDQQLEMDLANDFDEEERSDGSRSDSGSDSDVEGKDHGFMSNKVLNRPSNDIPASTQHDMQQQQQPVVLALDLSKPVTNDISPMIIARASCDPLPAAQQQQLTAKGGVTRSPRAATATVASAANRSHLMHATRDTSAPEEGVDPHGDDGGGGGGSSPSMSEGSGSASDGDVSEGVHCEPSRKEAAGLGPCGGTEGSSSDLAACLDAPSPSGKGHDMEGALMRKEAEDTPQQILVA